MENKLFTETNRIKYILDTLTPFDNAETFKDSLYYALLPNASDADIYDKAIQSMELGFDSLAILDWFTETEFNRTVKKAVEKYNLDTIYFGSRATDFVDDLERYFKLGFHVEGIASYKESRTVTRKVLKLTK